MRKVSSSYNKNNKPKQYLFTRPQSLKKAPFHYCAGCGHSIIHRLLCEIIDELAIREKVIAVAPVGCAVLAYNYWHFDVAEAPHGRTPAVATGIKRVHPHCIVFTYQGDGDLAAIGTSEILHCANRNENITVIYVNNGVYGMTGGQMAPTTLLGQQTTTTPEGRICTHGYPLKITELIAQLDSTQYVARTKITTPKDILHTKACIRKAFLTQIQGKGFSLVEILSMCPTYNGKTLKANIEIINQQVERAFPLGILKDICLNT